MYDRSYGPFFRQNMLFLSLLTPYKPHFLAIFIKFEQNVYGHKISLRFGFGFDRTSMNIVMAPFSAKYAVFEFVNTLEVTFI